MQRNMDQKSSGVEIRKPNAKVPKRGEIGIIKPPIAPKAPKYSPRLSSGASLAISVCDDGAMIFSAMVSTTVTSRRYAKLLVKAKAKKETP